MNFPTLYKKASTGNIQVWRTWVDWVGDSPAIFTEYGILGGSMQLAEDVIREGKNVGKANETTPLEQARAEARSQWEKKKKKRYVETVAEAQAGTVDTAVIQGGVAPMLAHKYHEQGHKISFPAYVQPKLDGHRCIAVVQDGKCTLWSRTQKRITSMPHIERAVEKLCGNDIRHIVLDGELYNHDYKDKFEQLSSKIRKAEPQAGGEVVQYWVYDVAVNLTFQERYGLLESLEKLAEARGVLSTICILPTFVAQDEEGMVDLFGIFMNDGYEGAIVRNAKGVYENRRSYGLQKVKVFDDAEFEIVNVVEGRGAMAGKAIFVCTAEGGEFNVKMMGDLGNLKKIFANKDDYIGRMLTVKYQGISAYKIPRFPVGVRLREDI